MLHFILIRAQFNKINTREGMWGEIGKHRGLTNLQPFVIFNEAIYFEMYLFILFVKIFVRI